MMASQSWLGWTALLLTWGYTTSKHIHTFAGPYIAYAHRFDNCPSDGTVVFNIRNSHFNPLKPYERQRLFGNVTFKGAVDDSFWGRVSVASRSNNEWKENAFVFNFPSTACSRMREHIPDMFNAVTKAYPEVQNKKNPCKLHSSVVVFQNDSVSWEFPKVKIMPYARYRFTLTVGPKGSQVKKMCLAVDCEVIPKP